MSNSDPTYFDADPHHRIEIVQAQRGWIARLRDRGLAARGRTEEEAVERVRATASLVDRLAQRWTGGEA
jgi:hypothetical protein